MSSQSEKVNRRHSSPRALHPDLEQAVEALVRPGLDRGRRLHVEGHLRGAEPLHILGLGELVGVVVARDDARRPGRSCLSVIPDAPTERLMTLLKSRYGSTTMSTRMWFQQ